MVPNTLWFLIPNGSKYIIMKQTWKDGNISIWKTLSGGLYGKFKQQVLYGS